jgi:hypothetical protein
VWRSGEPPSDGGVSDRRCPWFHQRWETRRHDGLPLAFGASHEPQSGRDASNLQTVGLRHPKRQFGVGHDLRHDTQNPQPPQKPSSPSSLNVFHQFIMSDFFLLSKASKAESNQYLIARPALPQDRLSVLRSRPSSPVLSLFLFRPHSIQI